MTDTIQSRLAILPALEALRRAFEHHWIDARDFKVIVAKHEWDAFVGALRREGITTEPLGHLNHFVLNGVRIIRES